MLQRIETLVKCSVRATDGAIGRVTDAYFDDEQWAVRYLVIDTGMWLGWHVLIAPQSIAAVNWEDGTIDVALSRDQVERSPRADLQHPAQNDFDGLTIPPRYVHLRHKVPLHPLTIIWIPSAVTSRAKTTRSAEALPRTSTRAPNMAPPTTPSTIGMESPGLM